MAEDAEKDYSMLTEESRAFMEMMNALGPLDLSLTVEEIRQLMENASAHMAGSFTFKGSSEEANVTYRTKDGQVQSVPITILRPPATVGDRQADNVLVYFHGGGFVWGSRQTHMRFCELVATKCNCVVVNVEYRLAPENRYPACMEDSKAVTEWCLDNKNVLSGTEKTRLGVAGDSAGGNIAACLSHTVPGIDYQILIYPGLDFRPGTDYKSAVTYKNDFLLTDDLMRWFAGHIFETFDPALVESGSPMCKVECLSKPVPSALILVAECDILADQGVEYSKRLDKAGSPSELIVLKGAVHGFVEKPGVFQRTNTEALEHMNKFLSKL